MAKLYRAIAIIKRMLKYLPPEQHYLRLAKKPASSAVVCLNEDGKVLLVKPYYRDFWMLPGGSHEEMESPSGACKREAKEEIGIDLPELRLLVVEYYQDATDREYFTFTFYGGTLTKQQIEGISLQKDELTGFGFYDIEEVRKIGSAHTRSRIELALMAMKDKQIVYLENGNELP